MKNTIITAAGPAMSGHTRYLLEVRDNNAGLDVLSFRAREALSQPYRYIIHFNCRVKDICPQQMLGRQADFTLQAPALPGDRVVPLRKMHGLIRQFARLGASADEARYRVELAPRLALLANSGRSAIYQQRSVPEIVEKILRERHGFDGADFIFSLVNEYPRRDLVCQWREDDLAFVQRILAEVGIFYRFIMDERLHREVVVFSDDRHGYQFDIRLPLQSPAGMNDNGADGVWGLKIGHRVATQGVLTHDYNYRDAKSMMQARANATPAGDATCYGEAYLYAPSYREPGSSISLKPETGAFYARLRHECLLHDRTTVSGHTTSPTLAPGQVLMISGPVPSALACGVLITAISTRGARNQSFTVRLRAVPYNEQICFRPPVLARPTIAGTVPARIASMEKHDTYAWLDAMGRYRVKMNFDLDSWEPGHESLWVRLARPYAGDNHGFHAPLLDGTEVALAFEDGNPDRPYIACALHDSLHPDPVNQDNHKRNVFRTPANNKLRLDDERGKEHIKLATEYGKSQLNLGHLVDNGRRARGAGFELRTDDWGAIRAGKGLFISADEQPQAQGDALEMQAALDLLARANEEMRALSHNAELATALAADIQTQLEFTTSRLAQLQSAVLLASAPQGIALTSGEHLQLSAKRNLMINAGKNADIGVMKNFFIGVGEALSVFVQKMGIKLIANQGKVEVQAQNDALELIARHTLTITSTDDEIIITTPKTLTLNGGGSYLKLDGNAIEHGSSGEFSLKCARYDVPLEASSVSYETPGFAATDLQASKDGRRYNYSE